jgi:hypothetical protein
MGKRKEKGKSLDFWEDREEGANPHGSVKALSNAHKVLLLRGLLCTKLQRKEGRTDIRISRSGIQAHGHRMLMVVVVKVEWDSIQEMPSATPWKPSVVRQGQVQNDWLLRMAPRACLLPAMPCEWRGGTPGLQGFKSCPPCRARGNDRATFRGRGDLPAPTCARGPSRGCAAVASSFRLTIPERSASWG